MTPMTLREMRPEDLPDVLRVIRLHDSDDAKAARQTFEKLFIDRPPKEAVRYWVALNDEGELAGVSGYAVDDLESKGIYWLGWTYVHPYDQGKGIGKALAQRVDRAVRELGARKLYCDTSSLPSYQPAVRFYHRWGFVEEGRLRDYYRDGEDKIILGLRL